MIDFAIDCPLFLRLTNVRLGENGLYRVSASGVSSTITEQDVEDTPIDAHFSAELLEDIQDARLPFPTTAQQLLAWMQKNKDAESLFPTWLEPAVMAHDAVSAHSVLNDAMSVIGESIQKQEAEITRGKSTQTVLNKLRAQCDAIESIKSLLFGSEDRQAGEPSVSKRQREDFMAMEIDAAIEALQGKSSPNAVMHWLKKQAGKEGSCVISADNDGVTWRSAAGGREGLSINALKQRLTRRKRQQGNAKVTAR